MGDVVAIIKETVCGSHDYWEEARRGLQAAESLDGLLPASRALPDRPEAEALLAAGQPAWTALLGMVAHEHTDTLAFKNALFLLMYFDSLFVYRKLKELYSGAPREQQRWLDVACRKIALRCLDVPETTQRPLTREIVRNTWRGRLATTSMMVDLAARAFDRSHGPVIIRDMAVSDGTTTLDLAEEAAQRGVDVSITGTDLRLYLIYAEHKGDEIVCYSDLTPCQYAIGGEVYGLGHHDTSVALASAPAELEAAVRRPAALRVTLLAPRVDHALQTGGFSLRFKEEDAFDPDPDIGQADIIRIANLFVERSEDHRGYYYRHDILKAISLLGTRARDGAYLCLDNFKKKVEHIGLWRKDGPAGEWIRLSVGADIAPDLEGVGNVSIGPRAEG